VAAATTTVAGVATEGVDTEEVGVETMRCTERRPRSCLRVARIRTIYNNTCVYMCVYTVHRWAWRFTTREEFVMQT
jgi:hypothetical protein